jgi:hypothetical protein
MINVTTVSLTTGWGVMVHHLARYRLDKDRRQCNLSIIASFVNCH